ncbi:MAG: phosphatase PAP2 family protein [Anaerolineaceae bacterium]|nr:phosphatase PAP2 family protein [Anaerolineaceae bacterium]
MEAIHAIEILVTYAIQGLGTWLSPFMDFFSFCATEEFFMLVMPILYWCFDTTIGMRVGVVLMLSSSIVDITKMACRLDRPYWSFPQVEPRALETSFGLPSGHTQKASAIWATMAVSFRKTWLWVLSIIMIIMIALSRIYLGVHFLSDVLTGLLISTLFLVLYLKLETPLVNWAKRQSPWVIFLFSLITCLIPILVAAAIRNANTGWQIPPGWLVTDIAPFSLEGILTINGSLFGMLTGYVWIMRSGGFQTRGNAFQLVLRYVVGVAGMLAIRYGLKFLFPESTDLLGYSLRFIRYGLIGLWLTALAPFLFIKLKISRKSRRTE